MGCWRCWSERVKYLPTCLVCVLAADRKGHMNRQIDGRIPVRTGLPRLIMV